MCEWIRHVKVGERARLISFGAPTRNTTLAPAPSHLSSGLKRWFDSSCLGLQRRTHQFVLVVVFTKDSMSHVALDPLTGSEYNSPHQTECGLHHCCHREALRGREPVWFSSLSLDANCQSDSYVYNHSAFKDLFEQLSIHPSAQIFSYVKGSSFTVQKPSCAHTLCALGDSVALPVLEAVKGHKKL